MMRIINILFLFLFFCSACTDEYTVSESPERAQGSSFRLLAAGYEGDAGTRSADARIRFDRLEHYIVDAQGRFVTNIRSLYDADLSQIRAEGFRDGRYELVILGVKGDAKADGAVIHELENINSRWLTLPQEGASLKAEYYYARHPFEVIGGQFVDRDVRLNRIVGKVEFCFDYASDYVRSSITSLDMQLEGNNSFATSLNADGAIAGERITQNFSLTDGGQYLFLPETGGSSLKGKVNVKSRRHTGELVERSFDFEVKVIPNRHSKVTIRVTHPDDRSGMLYIRKSHYTPMNSSTILADDEPKEVYYDAKQRSFNVNAPLQVSVVEDQLQLRFYSPLPMANVRIYGRLPGMNEELELAFVDSVPAFSNALFDFPMAHKDAVYHTETGRYVNVPAQDADNLQGMQFKIVSDDPYWLKISRIRAKWYITFNSYGGNPDAEDGSPAGNWMGMRPVHAREVVAALTNVAYLCTLDSYAAKLEELQGHVPGNDGKTPVDMSTVIPRLESHSRFNTGLVYTGNGVAGPGGGAVLGVSQSVYFSHYTSGYSMSFLFHELGHCMGYSHSSGMTYGRFSSESGNFYSANIADLPVYSKTILSSDTNPNKY